MGRAITLREDFKGPVLRRLAKASNQHHADAFTAPLTRVEPRGEHMAVHAGQLAFQPDIQII